jgi:hypothetical protein
MKKLLQFAPIVAIAMMLVSFVTQDVFADNADSDGSLGIFLTEGLLDLNDGPSFDRLGVGLGAKFVRDWFETRVSYQIFNDKRNVLGGEVKDHVHVWSAQFGVRAPIWESPLHVDIRPGMTILRQEETQFDMTLDLGLGASFVVNSGSSAIDFSLPVFSFLPNRDATVQNMPHVNILFEVGWRWFF